MKKINYLILAIMVVLLVFSWLLFFKDTVSTDAFYEQRIQDAKKSYDKGLYEQAIEYYKEALTYGHDEEVYLKIKETYDTLYAEEHIAYFRTCFINDMAVASQEFPENETFWLMQANLYIEAKDYTNAFETLKSARGQGVTSEEIEKLYTELLYMVEIGYKQYLDVRTVLNGYNTVFDGTNWKVLDDYGNELTSSYQYVGLINDEGKGLITNSIDSRIVDKNEVPRARFDIAVEEAGYYNESVDFLPVKVNGVWKYMNSQGEFMPGEFEIAGSFYGSQAVACADGVWVLLDDSGQQTRLEQYEDIKLDLYGCHIQNGIIIAKENGKYHLYDTNFEQISDFEADDIDICVQASGIAFQKDDLWGFVDLEGKVVIDPQFAGAKSFANGYAAVCNNDGLWGFINNNYELVIDYSYLNAQYFSKAETCWVSVNEGVFQLLQFVF